MSVTMELVRFTVVPGREEAFVAAREAAVEGFRTMPGMLSATLARADDGSWLDVILWRSREEALAADRAMQAGVVPAAVMEWASAIESVESMTHASVEHRVEPVAQAGEHAGPGGVA
jgi:heme-degrading monooxygenase HmoA